MRAGRFPGLEEALRARVEETRAKERKRSNRRVFLGASLGAVFGALTSALIRPSKHEPKDEPASQAMPDPSLEWARRAALGPLSDLLAGKVTFLSAVELAANVDAELWLGVVRLAHVAVERDDQDTRYLRRHILEISRLHAFPDALSSWLSLLQRGPWPR